MLTRNSKSTLRFWWFFKCAPIEEFFILSARGQGGSAPPPAPPFQARFGTAIIFITKPESR